MPATARIRAEKRGRVMGHDGAGSVETLYESKCRTRANREEKPYSNGTTARLAIHNHRHDIRIKILLVMNR